MFEVPIEPGGYLREDRLPGPVMFSSTPVLRKGQRMVPLRMYL